MSTLIEIQNQIAELQKQAAAIKDAEVSAAVRDIKIIMDAHGITLAQLQGQGIAKDRKTSTGPKTPVTVKFRGPNGETWTGRGLMPRWLKDRVATGESRDSFAV